MKYYVYHDGYGNANKVIGEEELAARYGNNPNAVLKEMLWSRAGEGGLGGRGSISVVNFESEQEKDEYLETLGEKISSYGGCRSQCQ